MQDKVFLPLLYIRCMCFGNGTQLRPSEQYIADDSIRAKGEAYDWDRVWNGIGIKNPDIICKKVCCPNEVQYWIPFEDFIHFSILCRLMRRFACYCYIREFAFECRIDKQAFAPIRQPGFVRGFRISVPGH